MTSINSKDVSESLQPQAHTNYFSQYGVSHNKLGAMLDLSKPKYEIPHTKVRARHYNVLTGKRCFGCFLSYFYELDMLEVRSCCSGMAK